MPVYIRNTRKTPVVVGNPDSTGANTLVRPLTITAVQTRSWLAFKRREFGQALIRDGHLVETDEPPEEPDSDPPEAA